MDETPFRQLRLISFNEAATHESRKLRKRVIRFGERISFNEAATHESRKLS